MPELAIDDEIPGAHEVRLFRQNGAVFMTPTMAFVSRTFRNGKQEKQLWDEFLENLPDDGMPQYYDWNGKKETFLTTSVSIKVF